MALGLFDVVDGVGSRSEMVDGGKAIRKVQRAWDMVFRGFCCA